MFDLQFFTALVTIFIMNIVLSGDNAVVIALASRKLPKHQQKKAIFWGTVGAVILLIVLTFAVSWLLKIPFLQFVGGLLLIWIAYQLLNEDHDDNENVEMASTLGKAIKTVIVADLIMSLDNVLAIAGKANGDLLLIILGVGFSVPLIIWGSTLLMKLMQKFPIIIWAGAGLLSWTAGEMINKGEVVGSFLQSYVGSFEWILPLSLTVAVLSVSFFMKRQKQNKESEEEKQDEDDHDLESQNA